MKGIIAEVRGNHMIVIAKNGDFSRCKKLPNCNIGDEINIPERNMKSIYKNLTAVAACFLILIMLSSGVYAYYTPYSYVSVDMNPSLELYVNRFERVIEVHAFNDEALQIIKASKGIKNKNVSAALEQILGNAEEAGYLKKDAENSLMIVVSSKNSKQEAILIDKMSKTSTEVLSNISSNYEVIMEKIKMEKYQKAKEQNISPGKVMLANRFKQAKPEIDEEKVKNMPLQQAIKQIEKKEVKVEDKVVKPSKATTAIDKPKEKTAPKSKVMNIKELIRDKNEELSDKMDREDDKNDDKKNKEVINNDKDSKNKDNKNNIDDKNKDNNNNSNENDNDEDEDKNSNKDKNDSKDKKNN